MEDYKIFNEDNYTPVGIRNIKDKLANNSIKPDRSLVKAIANGKTDKSLLPISICIRALANVNMYVKYKGVSNNIHLLGYTYLVTNHQSLFQHKLIALLIVAGVNLYLPIVDPNLGKIRKEGDVTKSNDVTVGDWLVQQGYDMMKLYQEKGIEESLTSENLNLMKILLDDSTADLDQRYNNFIIRSLSDGLAMKINPTDESSLWNHFDLSDSINYINLRSFKTITEKGYTPSYSMINDMIIIALRYSEIGENVAMEDIIQMLMITASLGIEFDFHQMELIKKLNPKLYDGIKGAFEQPMWKKACSNPHMKEDLPVNLKRNLVGANIPIDDNTCEYLENMKDVDIKKLQSGSKKRKETILTSELGHIKDYEESKIPEVTFANKKLIEGSPNDYSDIHEVHYSDSRGKNWIFTSDMYENLLKTRVNPVNMEKLPDILLDKIHFRKSILDKLGITKATKISESLTKLREYENIDAKKTFDEHWLHSLEGKGININRERLSQLTPIEIWERLNKIQISSLINKLEHDHAMSTFIWMMYWLSKRNIPAVNLAINEVIV